MASNAASGMWKHGPHRAGTFTTSAEPAGSRLVITAATPSNVTAVA